MQTNNPKKKGLRITAHYLLAFCYTWRAITVAANEQNKILNFPGEYKSICTISTSDILCKTFSKYFFETIHHFDVVD